MLQINTLKFLPFLYCCFLNVICQQFHEDFIRPDFCTDKVLTIHESYLTFEARSVIQCAARCSLENNCLSISFMKKEKNCFLNFGLLVDDCGNGVTWADSVYYKKKDAVKTCMNNGTLVNNDCVCYGGYIGKYCERLMTDCSEGFREMYFDLNLGSYEVLPHGAPQSFNVTCRMRWGGRTMILVHLDPLKTMNRSWSEYRDGFIESDYHVWMGLEKLYWLSRSKAFDLYIQFKKSTSPKIHKQIVYENFEMGDSSTNYRLLNAKLNLSRSGLTLVDCLSSLIGSSFSTYDMDNNPVSGLDCPLSYGSAWWYNGVCSQCNPLGDLHNAVGGTRQGVKNEIFWEPLSWRPESITMWFID